MSVPTRYVPSVSMVVLGANGGGGAVTTTVLVISSVDVSYIALWLDRPTRENYRRTSDSSCLPLHCSRVSRGVLVLTPFSR